MKNLYLKIILVFLVAFTLPYQLYSKDFTIIIDAGHGGKDAGSVDNGIKEKDINLEVSLRLAEILKKKMKDVKVVLTRSDDTYLTLQQRADKANSNKGDIFVSIHCNSVDMKNPRRKSVNGSSSHILGLHKDQNNMAVARRENSVIKLESDYKQKYSGFDPNSDESYIIFEMAQKKNLGRSIKLANKIQKQLKTEAGRKDNGVHQNGFWVLWATSMPAVLVELDFICNPESASFMGSKDGQNKFATAIYKAIESYYEDWKNPSLAENDESEIDESKSSEKVSFASNALTLPHKVERVAIRPESRSSYSTSGKRKRRSESARIKSASRDVSITEIFVKPECELNLSSEDISQSEINHSNTGKSKIQEEKTSDKKSSSKTKTSKKKNSKEKSGKKDVSTTVRGQKVVLAQTAESEKKATSKKSIAHSSEKSSKNKDKKRAHLNHKNYYVQLIVSDKQIHPSDPRLSGLPEVKCVQNGDRYTYICDGGDNFEEAKGILSRVKNKFSEAMIVSSSN